MLAPPEDEEEANEHATEVGEVGHAVEGVEDTLENLDGNHADDEPLDFDRHEEIEVDVFVREGHAESQQDAVDRTGGTDGDMQAWHQHIEQPCANTADKIVEEEPTGTPEVLHGSTEHPEVEHIEEDVAEVGMHKHIGEGLPGLELVGRETEECQILGQIDTTRLQHVVGSEDEDVDDEQMFDCRG